jgi:hypothetical protein
LDPRLLNEGPRPKSGKIETKPTWHHFGREIQLVQTQKKKGKKNKGKAHDLEIQGVRS